MNSLVNGSTPHAFESALRLVARHWLRADVAYETIEIDPQAVIENVCGYLAVNAPMLPAEPYGGILGSPARQVFLDPAAVVEPAQWNADPVRQLSARRSRFLGCYAALKAGQADPVLALIGYEKRDAGRFLRLDPDVPHWKKVREELDSWLKEIHELELALTERRLGFG